MIKKTQRKREDTDLQTDKVSYMVYYIYHIIYSFNVATEVVEVKMLSIEIFWNLIELRQGRAWMERGGIGGPLDSLRGTVGFI